MAETKLTLSQKQSFRIRNLHRLSEIGDAQKGMDELEREVKTALSSVFKEHGLRMGDFTVTLNLGKMPSLSNGPMPSGYLSCSLFVE